jgi:nucleotide-binding universal stress UspA family protein
MPQRPARVRAFAKRLPTGVADEVDDARAVGVHDADPALVIAGVAAEENAWLIVVGAGERGKLARRIIGGVVDLVVERATCNVLIVRPSEPG